MPLLLPTTNAGLHPLRNGGKGFLSFFFPTLLQVFNQSITSWLNPTTPPQQTSGAEKCIAPGYENEDSL
jgi:hypothetical protein